jgi:hypothetical protein
MPEIDDELSVGDLAAQLRAEASSRELRQALTTSYGERFEYPGHSRLTIWEEQHEASGDVIGYTSGQERWNRDARRWELADELPTVNDPPVSGAEVRARFVSFVDVGEREYAVLSDVERAELARAAEIEAALEPLRTRVEWLAARLEQATTAAAQRERELTETRSALVNVAEQLSKLTGQGRSGGASTRSAGDVDQASPSRAAAPAPRGADLG